MSDSKVPLRVVGVNGMRTDSSLLCVLLAMSASLWTADRQDTSRKDLIRHSDWLGLRSGHVTMAPFRGPLQTHTNQQHYLPAACS